MTPSNDFEWYKRLPEAMAGAWLRFAKIGDPNGEGLSAWPAYRQPAYQYLNYYGVIAAESGFRETHMEFCKRVLKPLRHSPVS
jgi:para-nitrobenzyl esterase